MKTKLLTFFIGAVGLLSTAKAQNVTQLVPGKDFPAEIENPECLGINKEPAHASKVKEIVQEEGHSIKGVFRLAILPTIAPYLLPRFFPKLMEDYPDLDIRVTERKTQDVLVALAAGKVDAAILATVVTDKSLQAETLFYEQFLGYVARKEPIFKNEMIRSTDISGERLWLLDEGHCFRDQLMRFCQLETVKLHQAAYHLGSMETFMRIVEGGKGITFIPELASYQLSQEQKELVRPFAIPRPTREISIVTKTDFVRYTILNMHQWLRL